MHEECQGCMDEIKLEKITQYPPFSGNVALGHRLYFWPVSSKYFEFIFALTLCIWETPKWVLLQTMKTQ